MKRFLPRRFRPTEIWDRTPEAAALSQLVKGAEPDADLLTRIEAQIDAEAPAGAAKCVRWRNRLTVAALMAVVAAVSGTAGFLSGADRQRLVARPAANADWVHLGAVSLHGPALRAFVRGKCKGYTHFYISMYGVSVTDAGPENDHGQALASEGEKIMMECIF